MRERGHVQAKPLDQNLDYFAESYTIGGTDCDITLKRDTKVRDVVAYARNRTNCAMGMKIDSDAASQRGRMEFTVGEIEQMLGQLKALQTNTGQDPRDYMPFVVNFYLVGQTFSAQPLAEAGRGAQLVWACLRCLGDGRRVGAGVDFRAG